MKTVKRKVWGITYHLMDIDPDTGDEMNWTEPFRTCYADTYAEAEEKRRRLLAGEDEYYGDLIDECDISDEPEEIEFYVQNHNIYVMHNSTLPYYNTALCFMQCKCSI